MNIEDDDSELARTMRQRPGVSADVVIEDLAEQLGRECEVEVPVDLHLVASMQGISDITETQSSHSGCLINTGGSLRIELCATDGPTRQRFTIGHEVCHTLLPGFRMERNFRCNPGAPSPRTAATQLNVEGLADLGASELLLPRRFVRQRFAAEPFGWDTIEEVAHDFDASLEATARRFVRLSPTPAIFVRLVLGTSKSNPVPALRVRSSSSSPELHLFIPPNKSLPRNHPVHHTTFGEDVSVVAEMRALKAPGTYRIAARQYPLPTSEGETVMSVMLLGLKTRSAPGGAQ